MRRMLRARINAVNTETMWRDYLRCCRAIPVRPFSPPNGASSEKHLKRSPAGSTSRDDLPNSRRVPADYRFRRSCRPFTREVRRRRIRQPGAHPRRRDLRRLCWQLKTQSRSLMYSRSCLRVARRRRMAEQRAKAAQCPSRAYSAKAAKGNASDCPWRQVSASLVSLKVDL